MILGIGDSVRFALLRRPSLAYRLLLIICLFGTVLALVSVVKTRSSGRQSDHASNFRPVYGLDDDAYSQPHVIASAKNNSGIDDRLQFSKLNTPPYEIKSCLSPDLQVHEEATCRFFAIMMDAGSTGTRVHIFEFSHNIRDKSAPFKLEQEIYGHVTPGLSSYLNDPKQAAKSILPLLNKAKSVVPKSQWVHTPLALKATAGLRLLDAPKADAIIDEVDKIFDDTGFLTNEDSVSIMTGIDEGIFGWFTLNFLLERLSSLKYDQFNKMLRDANSLIINPSTAAALDLGGGSTQITFKPRVNLTLQNSPKSYIKQLRLFSKSIDLYTHSYLGNGLMAARLNTLELANMGQVSVNSTVFASSCLPPRFSLLWKYNDISYNVSGNTKYSYEICLEEQTNFTSRSITHNPIELKSHDIYAFGYFFDRAYQAGITGTNGGYVTLADFVRATKKACIRKRLGAKHWDQWKCHDLAYIIALLRAYGLPDDKPIQLTQKLRSMEVSWALGASYHLLNTYHESKKAGSSIAWPNSKSSRISSKNGEFMSSNLSHFGGSSTSCAYDDLTLASGGALNDMVLNFTAAFICSRLYYGFLSLIPASFAQFA